MSSNTSTIAKYPFDDPAADVILRTADDFDFYVFKAVLRLSSPFFRDMFSLTQPPASTESNCSAVDSTPVISITEKSTTIDFLLRLCYPTRNPPISDLSLLENVLEAAEKYQIEEAIHLTRDSVRKFVASHALDVYAISCRFGYEVEARLAAEAWRSRSSSLEKYRGV